MVYLRGTRVWIRTLVGVSLGLARAGRRAGRRAAASRLDGMEAGTGSDRTSSRDIVCVCSSSSVCSVWSSSSSSSSSSSRSSSSRGWDGVRQDIILGHRDGVLCGVTGRNRMRRQLVSIQNAFLCERASCRLPAPRSQHKLEAGPTITQDNRRVRYKTNRRIQHKTDCKRLRSASSSASPARLRRHGPEGGRRRSDHCRSASNQIKFHSVSSSASPARPSRESRLPVRRTRGILARARTGQAGFRPAVHRLPSALVVYHKYI